jgi:hypothetical protein
MCTLKLIPSALVKGDAVLEYDGPNESADRQFFSFNAVGLTRSAIYLLASVNPKTPSMRCCPRSHLNRLSTAED